MDAVQVKLGAAYSVHIVSTSRDLAFGGFTDQLTADYLAGTGQIFGEIGYTIDTPNGQIEPFAGLAIIRQDSAGFVENGGAAALTVASASQIVGVTTVGVRGSATLSQTEEVTVKLTGALGWRHAFGDLAPQSQAGFASGGDSFTIAGAPIDRDTAIIEVGLDAEFAGGTRAGLAYRGQIGGNAQSHGVFLEFSKAL